MRYYNYNIVLVLFILIYWGFIPLFAIVPKPGVAIEKYAKPAEGLNNIGRLMSKGKVINGEIKTSSCSSTLIGIDGDVGIVLTAGHCAELTPQEEVTKCRFQTVSFAPNQTDSDPHQTPVIGRFALGKYIESLDNSLAYDLGVVFIDMKDFTPVSTPKRIQLDPTKIPSKSMVQVVGYGRTSEEEKDKKAPPQRRIMSTQAFRTQEQTRDLLLLDEAEIETQPMLIPVGDHPAEGDSGGPIIDVNTGAIIGVVSHKSGTNAFYSEPLYPHAEWLLAQIRNASRYFVFKPKKSGKVSDNTTWTGGRRPVQFKNAYGEVNPIVEVGGNKTLSFDEGLKVYAVNMVDQGGTLDIKTEQSAELLRMNAPTVIKSATSKTFTVDDVNVATSEVSLQTKLRVLHSLHIQKSVEMDVQKDNPSRGLTLVDNGIINVEGTLKTHHVDFAPKSSNPSSVDGCLQVSGTLISTQPINHSAHTIQGIASTPGRIISDYSLSHQGILSFDIDTTSPASAPILTFEGAVNFIGGKVTVHILEELPVGFEQTLLTAKELNVTPDWKGVYFINSTNSNTEVKFTQTSNKLAIQIIPAMGGGLPPSPSDELLN